MTRRLRRPAARPGALVAAGAAGAAVRPGHFRPVRSAVGDGVLAGSGRVNGRVVCAWAQDGVVQGRLARASAAARRSRARSRAPTALGVPVVGFPHSGGARLQEGVAALTAYAAIFRAQSLADVPQISVIGGPCAGGAAYSPALGDLTVMAGDGARMFLTGPAVVERVTREHVTAARARRAEGPRPHRRRRTSRPTTTCTPPSSCATRSPTCPRRRAARCRCTPRRTRCPATRPVSCRRATAPSTTCATSPRGSSTAATCSSWRRAGRATSSSASRASTAAPVGVIANQPRHLGGTLDAAASQKGAWFVDLCDRFGLPLVVLVDTPGFLPGVAPGAGRRHSPRGRASASLRACHHDPRSPSRCARPTAERTSS